MSSKIAVVISTVLNMFFAGSSACLWVGVAQPAMAQQKVASGESDSRQIERGRYLVKISGCNDCDTAGSLPTQRIDDFEWMTLPSQRSLCALDQAQRGEALREPPRCRTGSSARLSRTVVGSDRGENRVTRDDVSRSDWNASISVIER
jgi:hypothetical protein